MNGMITVAKNSNNKDFIQYSYSIGVRDFRLNMDYEKQAMEAIENIHSLNLQGIHIYADFQGVKMRLQLESGMDDLRVNVDDTLFIYNDSKSYPYISNFDIISNDVRIGDKICFSDDKIEAVIQRKEKFGIEIRFIRVDYVLRQNAGCSVIGDHIPTPHMTRNICNAIAKSNVIQEKKVDWVILSFMENVEEITDFVQDMHKLGISVMAKIETGVGVDNINSIATIVDGFMVGRGDLKSTTKESYPLYYERAIKEISKYNELNIGVGTFFLADYSQTCNISDVEIADIETVKKLGYNYIMLSKEVVNSKYPYETINMLQQICKR